MASKIRVKVDNDFRIWKFLIEPEWTKIKHLEKYLKEIFKLEEIVILDDDGFLHPNSNISYVHCMAKNNEILTIKSSFNIKCESPISKISPKRKKHKLLKCDQSKNNELVSDSATSILIPEPKNEIKQNSFNNLAGRIANFSLILNSSSTEGVFDTDTSKDNSFLKKPYANVNEECLFEIPKKRRLRKKKEKEFASPEKLETLRLHKNSSQTLPTKNKKATNENASIKPDQYKDKNHIRFDDSGEAVEKRITPSITFINYLDNSDFIKPRDIKSVTVYKTNQDSTQNVLHGANNISCIIECDTNNSYDNVEASSEMIGPKISAEFLNHKLEKWDDLANYDTNSNPDKIQLEIELDQQEKPKVKVISNEIIANGAN